LSAEQLQKALQGFIWVVAISGFFQVAAKSNSPGAGNRGQISFYQFET